jgi:hypothetical protein
LERQPEAVGPVAARGDEDDERRPPAQPELRVPLSVGPVGEPTDADERAPDTPARVAVDDGDDDMEPLGLCLRCRRGRRDVRPLLGRV